MATTKRRSRRTEQCVYIEGGRRCRRSGTGDPSLCHPHRIVMADAGRPRQPGAGIADLLDRVLNGKRVDRRVIENAVGDAADWVFGGQPGQAPPTGDGRFRPPSGFSPPPGWWPRAAPPPPPPDPKIVERARARGVLGFSPSQSITVDVISSRRKELARKHHPDRGGSLTKMQAINAAADFLIDDLSRQGAPSPA